jgi:hypothetical protein
MELGTADDGTTISNHTSQSQAGVGPTDEADGDETDPPVDSSAVPGDGTDGTTEEMVTPLRANRFSHVDMTGVPAERTHTMPRYLQGRTVQEDTPSSTASSPHGGRFRPDSMIAKV